MPSALRAKPKSAASASLLPAGCPLVTAKQALLWMRVAYAEARKAAAADEVPVGAVLVHEGRIIARDRNRIIERRDPTAHAEILVVREAARRLQNERLRDTILVSTLEPCAMCAGALVLARIAGVIFATADPKAGAGGSVMNILHHSELNHRISATGGVLAPAARRLLQRFFRAKRKKARLSR